MGEIDKNPKQLDLVEYIEDAESGGPAVLETTYTDEELDSAGLVAVKAFVRSKASKNAARVRRAAERRERGENGPPRKQLNLQAPVDEDAREVLKQLNNAMLEQELTADDINDLLLNGDDVEWRQRAIDAERERDWLRQQLADLQRRPRWLRWLFGRP